VPAVAGEVEGFVVVLLLAVYDLDVGGREVFGVGDGYGPVRGAQQQAFERNVARLVNDVTLDAGAVWDR
jgi:hypothetical protein